MTKAINRRRFLGSAFALSAGGIFVPRIVRGQFSSPGVIANAEAVPPFTPDYATGFETSGVEPGWFDFGTTPQNNWDGTPALTGAFSLIQTGQTAAFYAYQDVYTGASEMYAAFEMEINAAPNSSMTFFRFMNSGSSTRCSFTMGTNRTITCFPTGGGTSPATAAMPIATKFWVKCRYKPETAPGNGEAEVWATANIGAGWGTGQGDSTGADADLVAQNGFMLLSAITPATVTKYDQFKRNTTDIPASAYS